MEQDKTILYEILNFLDWREYVNVCDELELSLRFHVYAKCNNSLENFDNCQKYLKDRSKIFKNVVDCASFYGHLDVVKYLHSICKECSVCAIYFAILNGYLEIVKYLHKNYIKVFDKIVMNYAINYASMNEHLEVLKYLKSI
jgi:hypothetical protein